MYHQKLDMSLFSIPFHTRIYVHIFRNGSNYVKTFARSLRTTVDSVAVNVKEGAKTLINNVDKLNFLHHHQGEIHFSFIFIKINANKWLKETFNVPRG